MNYPKVVFKEAEILSVELPPSTDQESALSEILFGIVREWGLSVTEVSSFLGCDTEIILKWQQEGRASTNGNTLVRQQLLRFIKLWQGLSSLIASRESQIDWIRKTNKGFNGKSPLELVKTNPENLRGILEVLSRLRNP